MTDKMNPLYYYGVDHTKTGDELITEERDRQVNNFGHVIARDLATWRGEELENTVMSLLTGINYVPNIWGDNDFKSAAMRSLPIQVRRVMAGAILCALIDVDNLKYQILINEQKTDGDALRGNEKG